MTPEEFIDRYQQALATQRWASVEPLVHADACVTFSTGAVHRGRDAVRAAYEANFAAIADEVYRISDVHWILRSADVAVYSFAFAWSGVIGGRAASGGGRGTSVLVREGADWKLIAEQLGPGAGQEPGTSSSPRTSPTSGWRRSRTAGASSASWIRGATE